MRRVAVALVLLAVFGVLVAVAVAMTADQSGASRSAIVAALASPTPEPVWTPVPDYCQGMTGAAVVAVGGPGATDLCRAFADAGRIDPQWYRNPIQPTSPGDTIVCRYDWSGGVAVLVTRPANWPTQPGQPPDGTALCAAFAASAGATPVP